MGFFFPLRVFDRRSQYLQYMKVLTSDHYFDFVRRCCYHRSPAQFLLSLESVDLESEVPLVPALLQPLPASQLSLLDLSNSKTTVMKNLGIVSLLIMSMFLHSCFASKALNKMPKNDLLYLIKSIDSVNNWYIIYAEKKDSVYKIVVKKEKKALFWIF